MTRKTIFLLFGAFLFAACSSQDLSVREAWARPGFSGGSSAVYLTIQNPTSNSETLQSITSDVAENIEIHQSEMDDGGVISMHHQPEIYIPAKEKVKFQPGGLHAMLMNLKKDLKPGDQFEVTLYFQNRGALSVKVEVREP